MITSVIITFIIGYLLIVFEHPLKLNKTVPALLMAGACWAIISLGHLDVYIGVNEQGTFDSVILHHLGKTAEILVFLIGAMTIVEIVDLHNGFGLIKKWVTTKDKTKLLWITAFLGFFLSAVIDNLTATIVLVNILRKLIPEREERIWYASIIVIAANAGGAWTPIGDVTTTMLWIGDKVTTIHLIDKLFIPSLVCILIPVSIASFLPIMKGEIKSSTTGDDANLLSTSRLMFFLGITAIVLVPIFKVFLHLPPYLGMMLSLGLVWTVSEYLHPEEIFEASESEHFSAHHALSRIDMASILFFLGILMAVGALEATGVLHHFAEYLREVIPAEEIVIMLLGFMSAIIDNVPLVAATMGIYTVPTDHEIWHLIAFACGTGGSMLIIGSVAGVAAMGLEKIDFIWYLKKISWLAALGFLGGYILLWAVEVGF